VGFPAGSPDHAYCTERERDRYQKAVNDALNSIDQAIQQYNANRPRTCYSSGGVYGRSYLSTTTCY
jgi:hypothetical protein